MLIILKSGPGVLIIPNWKWYLFISIPNCIITLSDYVPMASKSLWMNMTLTQILALLINWH